jgi:membrane protein
LPSFRISSAAIVDGKVRLRGLAGPTGENIEARQINIRLKNLTNSPQGGAGAMASASSVADVMSGGKLECNARGFPLATSPTFNLDFQTRNIDLPELRSLIEKTTNVTVEEGTLDLYAEAVSADGNIRGYINPVFDHLELGESRDRSVVGKIKNGLTRMLVSLLKNRRRDRIATRLDFDGPVEDPQGRLLGAVGGLFRNAFMAAERASFDYRFWLSRSRSSGEILIGSRARSFSKARAVFSLLKKTFGEWSNDGAPRMAAALSYYTAFSMAPLLILAIAVAGVVLGPDAAQGKIVAQIGGLVGTQSADAIQSMIKAANRPSEGIFATIIGIVSLIGGATGVLSELKSALNRIWRTEESTDVKEFVKKNILFLGMVLGMGFLLTVSLVVSAAISGLGKYLGGLLPASEFLLHIIDFVFSLGFVAALFAAMYKFLPNAEVAWRDVWIGAVVTSFLFAIGKLGLGIYIGKSAVASSYGAAGAVLIILLWVYYSGLIFYFGAEFTRVYAELWGSRKHAAVSPMNKGNSSRK